VSDDKSSASRSGMMRRPETLLGILRRFGRLWGFLAFLVAIVLLFRGVVLPFIFGLLIAYLLAPVVARLQPRIGRVLAVILCYVLILGALGAFFGLLLPAVAKDLAKLRDAAPAAIENLNEEWIPRASTWAYAHFGDFLPAADSHAVPVEDTPSELVFTPLGDGSYRVDLDAARLAIQPRNDGSYVIGPPPPPAKATGGADLSEAIRELIAGQGEKIGSYVGPAIQAIVTGVAGFLTNFVITFMIAGFVLVDLRRVNRFVRSLIPYEFRLDFEEVWASMDKGLGGVVRGQLLICLVNGALTFVGLVIFQVKYSFLLALMAGAFSLIPIFGTIISSIPIIIIALVSSGEGLTFGPALGMLAWISGIHLLEANVLNPKIIGDSAHIHPVIVIFALLAGEEVFGLVGALLAIPATSLVQTLYLYARRRSSVFSRDSDYAPHNRNWP
jgi:predicted PurR-regulated permease PerM